MYDLSLIIITYNSKQLLEPCIQSIRRSLRGISCEIIVVENGSQDGSLEWLHGQEDVIVLSNDRNRGVAPARNQGLQVSKGRYLMILDVDTRVEPEALDILVNCMDSNPRVGLGAPKLVDGAGHLQYTCRYYPTVMSKLYRRLPQEIFKEKLREEILADWPHDTERNVDYVIGAAQIFRREAFEQVGYLDESIFYGPEDIDYCLRMWKAGWQVRYFPQAVIRHLERRITTKLLSSMTLKHAMGLMHFFAKHKYLSNTENLPGCRTIPEENDK